MLLRTFAALLVLALTAATACAQQDEDAEALETARTSIVGRDDAVSGIATFTQGPTGVLIRLQLRDLPVDQRGAWHAVHLHEHGDCSNSDFTSAGSHINTSGNQHGLLNPDGPDNADLTNVWADLTGNINAELFTTRVSLNDGDGQATLMDRDGSALVIHAGPDDHTSQPIGGAGDRIACGVIGAE